MIGTSDGSIQGPAIGLVAEESTRELWACMQHSLTWREHARAASIGIQSAYRRGLRSCVNITTWVEHCPRTRFVRLWSTPHASPRYSDDRRDTSHPPCA